MMPRFTLFSLLLGPCLIGACQPTGRDGDDATPEARPPQSLTIAVADSGLTDSIAEIVSEYAALSQDEATTVAWEDDAANKADLLVLPAGRLGEWSSQINGDLLQQPSGDALDEPQIVRELVCNWSERTIAAPLTAPVLHLAIRRDVLKQLGSEPPNDWAGYTHLVKTLHSGGEAKATSPAIEPLAPGWAVHTFLTRAAAYAKHPNYFGALFEGDALRPRIADAPFERALSELIEVVGVGGESLELTCDDVRRRLYGGQASLGLCWPQPTDSAVGDQGVDFLPAPGSSEVYHPRDRRWMPRNAEDGIHVPYLGSNAWVFGVGAQSKSPAAALQLARWLAQSPRRTFLAPAAPAAPVRFSDLSNSNAWSDGGAGAAASFAKAADVVLRARDGLGPLRLPGADRYLAALDDAVRSAVAGDASPADALAAAAAAWETITEELGRETQAKLYRASVSRPAP